MSTNKFVNEMFYKNSEHQIQIKNQFDKKTLKKIFKGFLLASSGAGALFILSWIPTLDLGIFTPLVALAVPFFINLVNQYCKGATTK